MQDGGLQPGNTYISTCRHDSNELLTAIPMFSGSSNAMKLLETPIFFTLVAEGPKFGGGGPADVSQVAHA
jgi:hypothetical protein